ncbi:MAG: exosortase F system-associated protein [Cyclobacteriaceae bacterium]
MRWRIVIGILAVCGLFAVFVFQRLDVATTMLGFEQTGILRFIINRAVRFIVNDGLTILLIYALFGERKYVLVAFYIEIISLVFILIPYFVIKINYPHYNGPWINFIHRLVLNPLILMLLIPTFYYQKNFSGK